MKKLFNLITKIFETKNSAFEARENPGTIARTTELGKQLANPLAKKAKGLCTIRKCVHIFGKIFQNKRRAKKKKLIQ